MDDLRHADFSHDEFTDQNKDIRWLCGTIKKAGYDLGDISAPEDTIDWLNEILRHAELYDKVIAVKKSLVLTDRIKSLAAETAESRKKASKDLSSGEQEAIRKLNRLTIETAHPRETPMSSYELTALIRTKRGDNFLQNYPNIDAFRREMKEHREDIEWGLLVRCDEGKIIADYFSILGDREKIGVVETEPKSAQVTPEGLSPQQAALREAAIKHFRSNKAKAYISEQMKHVNINRQIGEAIKFLFDSDGNPPANAPIEDIIEERMRIEAHISWLEAICSELANNLSKIKEIEDAALKVVGREKGEG